MGIEIVSPGQLAALLRGQDVMGLRRLQASGLAQFDGGAAVNGPLSVNGVNVDGFYRPVVEATGTNLPLDLFLLLPAVYRSLMIEVEARSDQAVAQGLFMQFNDDGAAHYNYSAWQVNGATPTFAGIGSAALNTFARCGMLNNTGGPAGATPYTQIAIGNADSASQRKSYFYRSQQWTSDAAAGAGSEYGDGQWTDTSNPIRKIRLVPGTGGFVYIRARVYALS